MGVTGTVTTLGPLGVCTIAEVEIVFLVPVTPGVTTFGPEGVCTTAVLAGVAVVLAGTVTVLAPLGVCTVFEVETVFAVPVAFGVTVLMPEGVETVVVLAGALAVVFAAVAVLVPVAPPSLSFFAGLLGVARDCARK
jgi:hypothetical protein